MSREVETHMSKNTQHVAARDGDSLFLTLFQVIHVTASAWLLLMCCSCAAGHIHSHRLGVLTRNRHGNTVWPIWRSSDHAGNWGRRNQRSLNCLVEQGPSLAVKVMMGTGLMGKTSMHLSRPIQSWVKSSALTGILHLKRLISPQSCRQGKT